MAIVWGPVYLWLGEKGASSLDCNCLRVAFFDGQFSGGKAGGGGSFLGASLPGCIFPKTVKNISIVIKPIDAP